MTDNQTNGSSTSELSCQKTSWLMEKSSTCTSLTLMRTRLRNSQVLSVARSKLVTCLPPRLISGLVQPILVPLTRISPQPNGANREKELNTTNFVNPSTFLFGGKKRFSLRSPLPDPLVITRSSSVRSRSRWMLTRKLLQLSR